MKQVESDSSLRSRFDRAARQLEERVGHWPLWLKLLVFVPVLVALTAVVVVLMRGIGLGLSAIRAAIIHR